MAKLVINFKKKDKKAKKEIKKIIKLLSDSDNLNLFCVPYEKRGFVLSKM